MFLTLLFLLTVGWLSLALFATYWCKKTFKKYKDMPRKVLPQKYRHIIRKDLGKWDEKEIIRGCFVHFPLSFTALCSYIACLAILAIISKKIKAFDRLFHLFRKYGGLIVKKVYFKLSENYNTWSKTETPMIIANHVSENDHVYLMATLERVSFVAKKEIGDIPAIGTVTRYINTLFVDRHSADNRRFIKESIKERVKEYSSNPKTAVPVTMYPEGTVSNGVGILKFNNGAFDSLAPVTLFSFNYFSKGFDHGHDEINMYEHFLFSCCLRPSLTVNRCIVSASQGQTVESYRERCRQKIAEMGKLELSECNYKDVLDYWYEMQALFKQTRRARKQK